MINEKLLARKIKLLVDENPKRKNSKARARFDGYFAAAKKYGNGKFTVAQALEEGVLPVDIDWDQERHKTAGPFIQLSTR